MLLLCGNKVQYDEIFKQNIYNEINLLHFNG